MSDSKSKEIRNREIEAKRTKILSIKGGLEGLKYILESFKDENWRVRKTALDNLIENYDPDTYIKDLVGLLYIEDNAGARNTAIEALVRLGKKAVPYLVETFGTDNHDVRKFVIDVLGFIGGKEVFPLLLRAIKDEDENVRASAVEYLGKLKEASVIDSLVEIIETGDVWTAYPAVDALGRIGDRRAIPYLLKALKKRPLTEPTLKALSEFSEAETLKEIIPLLRDQRRSIQEETLKTIEKFYQSGISEEFISEQIHEIIGDDAFDILVRHASHKNKDVKGSAIVLLGLLRDHRAIKPLLDLSEDDFFRDAVKRSLLFIGKENPDYLIPLVKTEFPERRRLIVEVISELRNPRLYDILVWFLKDYDGHVIAHAIRGLGKIGDRRAVAEILPLITHPYPDVQDAAVAALTELKPFLPVSELIDKLKSRNAVLKKNAARILGNIHAVEATETLGFTVKDESEDVRKAAVTAISMIGTESASRYLRMALTDESPEIRAIATENLSLLGGMDALRSLVIMANDPDEGVRASAARCLSKQKDDLSLKTLIGLLKDSNGFVVTQAIESVSVFSHRKEARDAIAQLLNSGDREIRRTAILALSSFSGTEELISPYLFDEDWAIRLATVQALSRVSSRMSKTSLEGLYDVEDDPTVRKAIEVALGV